MTVAVVQIGRQVNLGALGHQGWRATSNMEDGDTFHFHFAYAQYYEYGIGLGHGHGPGNVWGKWANLRYAAKYVNSSTVQVFDNNGTLTTVNGSFSTAWWIIRRIGTDYVLSHYDTVVATWTDASAWEPAQHGYIGGVVASVDPRWELEHQGPGAGPLTYGNNNISLDLGGGGTSGFSLSRSVQ